MSYNQLMSPNINVVFCTRNLVHLLWVKKRHFKRFIWRKRTHGVSFLYRFGHFLLFSSTQACRIKRGHESLYPHNAAHNHSELLWFSHLWCVGHKFCPCAVRWTVRAAVKKTDERRQSVSFMFLSSVRVKMWVMQRLTASLISCQLSNITFYFHHLVFSLSNFWRKLSNFCDVGLLKWLFLFYSCESNRVEVFCQTGTC